MSLPEQVTERTIFPWTRYWVPLNANITVGGAWDRSEGFLSDPEDDFIGKHSNAHLRTTAQLLAREVGCLVLCGEPGMGKSQALRSHYPAHSSSDTIILEFRDIPDSGRFERVTVETPEWLRWRAGSHLLTLMIDGVDEGLIKIAGFVEYLTGLVRQEPIPRLQLVLACRSLEWPASEGERLLALWEKTAARGIWELCPLRECDARLAAEQTLGAGTKPPDRFMRAVRQHRIVGLASRPLTLKMLLREFRTGGTFSRSHRDLYRHYTHHLCGEHDDARSRRLRNNPAPRLHIAPAMRQRIAGRIAALLLLSGRSAIWPGKPEEAAGSDLTLTEIVSGPESIDGVDFAVSLEMIEAVLESPLFWPKNEGRVGFYHQTFAESLAAEYLRTLPFPQMRSLLCRRDRHGEFVHPPLSELAAWTATESEALLAHLLAHDPETLLRTDVSAIREAHRVALVEAVIAKATAGQLFDTQGLDRFFHTLNHPTIAEQLRPILRDRTRNLVTRRIAFDIATACEATPLLDDVLAIMADQRERGVHSAATTALMDLTTPEQAPQLVAFLKRRRSQPLSAQVRFALVRTLLKRGTWSLTKALPHVERALRTHDMSDALLAQFAQPSDAEALLRACLRWRGSADPLSRTHALLQAAHDHGLARIAEPRIRWLMARVWWQVQKDYRAEGFTGTKEKTGPNLHQQLRADRTLRRQFIDDIVSFPSGWVKDHMWRLDEIISPDDFPWLLTRAVIGSRRRRPIYS